MKNEPRRIHRIHRVTGVFILLYAGMHVTNHLFALGGIEQHIRVMKLLRHVYRHPLFESLLLLAIGAQIVTGLTFVWRSRGTRIGFFERAQAYAGLYLAFFLPQHLTATFFFRNLKGIDTNFYFASAVLLKSPYLFYFLPYYFLAVTFLFVHAACALRRRLLVRLPEEHSNRIAFAVMILGTIVSLLIVITFSGGFYTITLPSEYQYLQ